MRSAASVPPNAVNCEQLPSACRPPSKDKPAPGANNTSTPGSIVKSAVTERYPEGSVGLTLIGLSTAYHVVSSTMSALTVIPLPSYGITLYHTPMQPSSS